MDGTTLEDRLRGTFDEASAISLFPFFGDVEQYIRRIGNGDLEIEWAKILTGIDGVESQKAGAICLEYKADLPKFLERFSGINVDYEPWGGDMPGRDGIWIRVWIYAEDEPKITKALNEVVLRLKNLYPLG